MCVLLCVLLLAHTLTSIRWRRRATFRGKLPPRNLRRPAVNTARKFQYLDTVRVFSGVRAYGTKPALTLTRNGDESSHEPQALMQCGSTEFRLNWRSIIMLRWALIFFVLALVAALFGFGGIAAGAVGIAKLLFFGFLILAAVAIVANLARGRAI